MKNSLLLINLLYLLLLPSCSYYFGNSWKIKPDKREIVGAEKIAIPSFVPDSTDPIIKTWAGKELPDWQTEGKVNAPRVILAKLIAGQNVEEVNAYLAVKKPWGKNGTDWAFNPHGDYDFSEVPLVAILYLFGEREDLLYPGTKANLLNQLLTHEGNSIHLRAPRTLGILRETENHIFMGETSRYLKNQWLFEHGDTSWKFNNGENGLNNWWIACLNQKMASGFFEFNANPYSGYSLTALLTFYTFCHNREVREKCRALLDDIFMRYAYGSLSLRRYPPFRRRMERQGEEKFMEDPVTSIVRTLLFKNNPASHSLYGHAHFHHALLGLISNYELPKATIELLSGNKRDYFVKTGHGYRSCPEIYSGNADFLISAGGAQRGKISQISVHPIVLFLNDSATELKQCFFLRGHGGSSRWNMTGVYKQFACANHAVFVPEEYQPVYEREGWRIFKPYPKKNFYVLIYNADKLGLLAVEPESAMSVKQLVDSVISINSSGDLRQLIVLPFRQPLKIRYDVNAPKNGWVIKSVNGEMQDRRVDTWKY